MKILCQNVARHRLPFKYPFTHDGRVLEAKEVAILTWQLEGGKLWQMELGPFPGIHSESLSQLEPEQYLGMELDILPVSDWQFELDAFGNSSPKGQGIILHSWELMLHEIYLEAEFPAMGRKAAVAGLLSLNHQQYQQQLEELLASNCQAIKVKMGREPFSQELSKLQSILPKLGESCVLRIDANGKLSRNELLELESFLGPKLQFFEGLGAAAWPFGSRPVSRAFDEELQDQTLPKLAPQDYLVIKPMAMGVSAIYRFLSHGYSKDHIILSSTFDSGIATESYLGIATKLQLGASHGLGPYLLLREDIAPEPLRFRDGHLLRETVND